MKLYAHKGLTGTVKVAEDDGFIETQNGDIPYIKGEILFTDLNGNVDIITQKQLDENFVEVQIKDKKRTKLDREGYRRISRELGVVDY